MPFITISTLFLLAGVFAGGGMVSWYLSERRNERERARLEESMTRALQQRYSVYEDLEESFHRIFSRMDEIRERWQVQMAAVQASVAGNLGETTFVRQGVEELVARVEAMGAELHAELRAVLDRTRSTPGASERTRSEPSHNLMRVDDPELWDLEREFERRNAEQLAEISDKSQRVIELMDKVEALEPTALQLAERDREFVTLEAEREQLLRTNHALEETRRARVAELSQRIAELEIVEVEAGELRKQVQVKRNELAAQAAASKSQVTELECKVAEVSVELEAIRQQYTLTVEVAADERVRLEGERVDFDAERARFEEETQGLCARIAELEERTHSLDSEVSARDEILADREQRLNELQTELVGLQRELEQRATELDERERKFRELQDAWRMATGQVESQRTRLATHMGHFHAAQEMLAQLKPMLQELETRLTTDGEDEPTVVVSEAFGEREVLVDDGSLEDLPDDAEEIVAGRGMARRAKARSMSVDEPPSALPARDALGEAKGDASFGAAIHETGEAERR